jgi:hypothetical protein
MREIHALSKPIARQETSIETLLYLAVTRSNQTVCRAHVHSKIAIVTYQYRFLELEFREQTPFEYQLNLFYRRTLSHHEKEKA